MLRPLVAGTVVALMLAPAASWELLDAMRAHVLAQGDLVGIFQKPAGAGGYKWMGEAGNHACWNYFLFHQIRRRG